MDHDIEKAVRVIEAKIKELEQAKRTLIDLFGSPSITSPGAVGEIRRVRFTDVQGPPRPSRRQTIINLLTEKGPLTKKEITAMTDMPRGSVSFSLNDKKIFYSKEGKWHLVGVHGQPEASE